MNFSYNYTMFLAGKELKILFDKPYVYSIEHIYRRLFRVLDNRLLYILIYLRSTVD